MLVARYQATIELQNAAKFAQSNQLIDNQPRDSTCSFIVYIEGQRVTVPEIITPTPIAHIIMMDNSSQVQDVYVGELAILAAKKLMLWVEASTKDNLTIQEIDTHIKKSTEAFPLIVEMLDNSH
jgi:hypothetical protein